MEKKEFYQCILKFLLNEHIEEEVAKYLLAYKNWNPGQNYRVFRLDYLGNISKPYYCDSLEEFFQDCVAIPVDDTIYCIQNLSKSLNEDEHLPVNFSVYLRESLCRAGISNPCKGIFRIYQCKKEADIALRIGMEYREAFWYHWFRDYTLEYFGDRITRELTVECLLHPAVHQLMDYDIKNNTELLNTLKCYIACNENSTRTAEKMYIHRTTLIHRINKIQKLTHIELDKGHDKIHLMFSFYLLERSATPCSVASD